MRNYILKRLFFTLPMMLAISFIAFVLISFIPSDPALHAPSLFGV